jgi:hypothetical protein
VRSVRLAVLSELVKANIPVGYSAGHAASASQSLDSSGVCGWRE